MSIFTHLKKLGYAKVMATLGVFIALGGTSYAAAKIDGSMVRDGSLTGRDIRNSSLTGRDIKKRSIGASHLKERLLGKFGPKGIEGPRGPAGPPGVQGDRGPSNGTFVRAGSPVIGDTLETVAVLELDPGNWLLSASGLLQNQTGTVNVGSCHLFTAEIQGQDLRFLDEIGRTGFLPLEGENPAVISQDAESFSMVGAMPATKALQVHLMCSSVNGPIRVRHSTVTALQTAELTDQSKFPS